jgi:hypothetical protein
MWLLVEYPYGFALFILGGCGHWALNSAAVNPAEKRSGAPCR